MYESNRPTNLDKASLSSKEWIKQRTVELYDMLPQANITSDMSKEERDAEIQRALQERRKYTDIRDEVIELNYSFFGYVATHTFINNSSISYEDKFQSALFHFCEMWHWYKFAAKYRTDLSFCVFFKLRIGECIERELNEVKYSLRRDLCMKVGQQLGKHWGQVKYEDLSDPRLHLSSENMMSLQAMFGSMYWADLETHALFIESDSCEDMEDVEKLYNDNYDDVVSLLQHEMVEKESKLSDKDLLNLAIMFDLDISDLKVARSTAEANLYKALKTSIDIKHTFSGR